MGTLFATGGWVSAAMGAYIVGSILLLLLVKQLRLYPLYLLKTAWVVFTVVAFSWVVMMSGATNEEFAYRPAGFLQELRYYPDAFRTMFAVHVWWLAPVLWIPLWAVRGTLLHQRWRRACTVGLVALGAVVLLPIALLVARFDWTVYAHFVDNYRQAWRVARMGDYFFNSVLVSICAVGLVAVVGSMAAYGLSKLRFRGRGVLTTLLLAGLAIPGILLMVPLFVLMKDWSVEVFSFSNSRVGLATIYAATALPLTIFLLTAFYRNLPTELAKAAVTDGASSWQVFTHIYFPLSGPALATAAIFNFLAIWNEYHFALVFLTNPDLKTLPVGLYNLQISQQYAVNWPAMFAGIVILCLPTFLIFVALQERIVAGITIGGVKG